MLAVSNDYIGEIVSAELTENNGKVGAIVVVRPDGTRTTVTEDVPPSVDLTIKAREMALAYVAALGV